VASLYNTIEDIKTLLESHDYTVYDESSFEAEKITRQNDADYPIVLVSRGEETVNNDGEVMHVMQESAPVFLVIAFNTGIEELEKDTATELRKIKDIINTSRKEKTIGCDWKMLGNINGQLQSTNSHSSVFGGINIKTTVEYREQDIKGVL